MKSWAAILYKYKNEEYNTEYKLEAIKDQIMNGYARVGNVWLHIHSLFGIFCLIFFKDSGSYRYET